ncbi:MAG: ribosome maturation factor RimP [Gammaproteobacteria bacterium]|nr:ribosome maturation factor RimP [Gammaproteobacteria bacterium]
MANKDLAKKIANLIRPIITVMGYELWGCEMHLSGRYSLLRVYIDVLPCSPQKSVSLEDCTKVSNQISALLDVEDPISGGYQLEVSSPGLDRPLFELEQYRRFIGDTVQIKLSKAELGRRNYTGRIESVTQDTVVINVLNQNFEIPITNIDKANLVAKI